LVVAAAGLAPGWSRRIAGVWDEVIDVGAPQDAAVFAGVE